MGSLARRVLYSFKIYTDHKNLEYIKSAKRLNSKQTRCSLFFAHFDFTLSYLPGSKNVKADSLSRMYPVPPWEHLEESILPESPFLLALT